MLRQGPRSAYTCLQSSCGPARISPYTSQEIPVIHITIYSSMKYGMGTNAEKQPLVNSNYFILVAIKPISKI